MSERTLEELLDAFETACGYRSHFVTKANYDRAMEARNDMASLRAEILARFSPPMPDRIVRAWKDKRDTHVCYRQWTGMRMEWSPNGKWWQSSDFDEEGIVEAGNYIELTPAEVAALNAEEKR